MVAYIENRMVTFLCVFFFEIVNISVSCLFRDRATGLLLTVFTPRFIFNEGVSLGERSLSGTSRTAEAEVRTGAAS
jgi:hypothetical protein